VGVPFRLRGRRADEFVRCLKTIWTDDVVEFHGEFYHVPKAKVEPKPVQKPHPPITIGGYGGPAVVRRAVTLGDGFSGGNLPMARVVPLVREVRAAAEAAGRDLRSLHIVCRGTFQVHAEPQGADRRPLWGTLEEIREDIRRYAEAGLTELFLEGNFNPRGATIAEALEVMAGLAPARTLPY
jgi:alkanesulfonate monooxygenase SsuD/methylene tetrahydromethanopterin reductase-like flavin-dependent oxidoreductase (luciferase family)